MGHRWLLLPVALISMMGGRGLASSHRTIYSPVVGYNSSDLDQVSELSIYPGDVLQMFHHLQCKMGPTLRCERVNIDVATIKTEEFITFEGRDYKRAEKREEERDPGDKAGIYSFINDETGGLAVFLVSETTESDGGGGSVVDGKITMKPGGSFFVLESCGPDCGVLTQFEKRPKVLVYGGVTGCSFSSYYYLRFISDGFRRN